MLSLEARQDLFQVSELMREFKRRYVPDADLAKMPSLTLKHLSNALERGWISEQATTKGVRYTLTNAGQRELEAYRSAS